ncbi:MAG TPA: SIS domain-containing protein [Bauldia sp.]|nr:SIS domain-containing protein [Bauldia sp.]
MTTAPLARMAAGAEPSLMAREASEAPDVVRRLIERNADACRELGARLRKSPPRFVVTCARGSSDSAATYAKYLIELRLGAVVASVGPSVSSIYGARLDLRDALFIAISQSGRSPDILSLAQTARAHGALTVAVVNDTASPLASSCEVLLPLHAGPERSVAATKSYLASLGVTLQLVAEWSADSVLGDAARRLPETLAKAQSLDWDAAVEPLAAASNLYVAGRGVGYAAAQEAALKLKETSGLHAEALSAAELIHGPMALAGPQFPLLIFGQDDESLPPLRDTAATLAGRGVPVIVAAPRTSGIGTSLPTVEGLHPFVQPIATVQSFYRLADVVARTRGRDPDRPMHLRKVTETL